MHHAHVNCKEKQMKPITLEDFYNDPDFYGRVERAAQRERALAVRVFTHAAAGMRKV